MKRSILMVSAMILLLASPMQLDAKKTCGQDRRKPGMEMMMCRRPCKPMKGKTISRAEVEMIRDFYWKKYRVKLSKKEAEKILITEKAKRCHRRMPRRW
jgi:hypothetical protein